MKKKGTAFSIPEPCHEGWDNMKPAEKGRYCSSCEKVVVDFTTMSDFQIIDYMQKQDKKSSVCGRMSNVQMNRTMHIPSQSSIPAFSLRALVLGTALSAFASFDASAQEQPKIGKMVSIPVEPVVNEPIRGEIVATPVELGRPSTVSGFVTDSYSGNSLAYVFVGIYDAEGNVLQTIATDERGWYKLENINNEMAYSIGFGLPGYSYESRLIGDIESSLSVALTEEPYIIEGLIMQEEE